MIKNLNPECVWRNFDALTQVPRPSGHLEKIQQFLLDFAARVGVEAFKDPADNIVMRKPATAGMENRKGVILQAHMDMVPQKTPDSNHNFEGGRRGYVHPVHNGPGVTENPICPQSFRNLGGRYFAAKNIDFPGNRRYNDNRIYAYRFIQHSDKLEFVGLFGQWRAVPMRYTSLPPALVRGVVPVRTLVPGGVRIPDSKASDKIIILCF